MTKAAGAVLDQLPAKELARKLVESQQMIARFSRENERLADQNEQLTGSKQLVANDYKGELGVLDHNSKSWKEKQFVADDRYKAEFQHIDSNQQKLSRGNL